MTCCIYLLNAAGPRWIQATYNYSRNIWRPVSNSECSTTNIMSRKHAATGKKRVAAKTQTKRPITKFNLFPNDISK